MTSETVLASGPAQSPDEAYVWIFLPGQTGPVVAGRLYRDDERLSFIYGRSYLDRPDAIPLYEPELPLRAGPQPPDSQPQLSAIARQLNERPRKT